MPTKPGFVSESLVNIRDFLSHIKEDYAANKPVDSPSYLINNSLKKEENSIYLTDQIFQFLIA
jgi:hypothetical protein